MGVDQYDPTTRIRLGDRARFTLETGEEVVGYLKSFRRADGTWLVWTHRDGGTIAVNAKPL